MINAEKVKNIFVDCLYRNNEVVANEIPKEAIIVKGITLTVGFNPKRLEPHKEEIENMLNKLNDTYKKGWSFLNMCFDKNDEQWTGSHKTMEQLMILGMAINKIEYCCDREMWSMLPGGVPYIKIDL